MRIDCITVRRLHCRPIDAQVRIHRSPVSKFIQQVVGMRKCAFVVDTRTFGVVHSAAHSPRFIIRCDARAPWERRERRVVTPPVRYPLDCLHQGTPTGAQGFASASGLVRGVLGVPSGNPWEFKLCALAHSSPFLCASAHSSGLVEITALLCEAPSTPKNNRPFQGGHFGPDPGVGGIRKVGSLSRPR